MSKAPKPKPLTAKQERFCQLYTVHWNATRAAKEARYSEKTAMEQGYQLLQNPSVRARIEELTSHALSEIGVSRGRVLSELSRVALFDPASLMDDNGNVLGLKDMPEETRRAVASIEVFEEYTGSGVNRGYLGQTKKLKFWDKPRALELLGKHLKILTERHEHSGPDGKPIEHKSVAELTDEQLKAKIDRLLKTPAQAPAGALAAPQVPTDASPKTEDPQ